MMESDKTPLRVRCLLCCKIFECSRADTKPLLQHVRECHPEVVLKKSSIEIPKMDVMSKVSLISIKNDTKDKRGSANEVKFGSDTILPLLKRSAVPLASIDDDAYDYEPIRNNNNNNPPAASENNGIIPNKFKLNFTSTFANASENTKNISEACKKILYRANPKSGDGELNSDGKCPINCSPKKVKTDTQILYKRKYKFKKPQQYTHAGKRRQYKTTIEKWRPGKSTIFCPKCGSNKRPIIKSHIDKVSHTPIAAAFILTCWPLCFLPCLFPPPIKEHLHCSICHHFLGVYDHKAGTTKPNVDSLKRHPDEPALSSAKTDNNNNGRSQQQGPTCTITSQTSICKMKGD